MIPVNLRPTFHAHVTSTQREFVEKNVGKIRAYAENVFGENAASIDVVVPLVHNVRKLCFVFNTLDGKSKEFSFAYMKTRVNKMTTKSITAPAQEVSIGLTNTFIENASTTEAFDVGRNTQLIRAFATQIGADRVRVCKNLTNGSRPLNFHFYNRSRFVTNRTMGYIKSKVG